MDQIDSKPIDRTRRPNFFNQSDRHSNKFTQGDGQWIRGEVIFSSRGAYQTPLEPSNGLYFSGRRWNRQRRPYRGRGHGNRGRLPAEHFQRFPCPHYRQPWRPPRSNWHQPGMRSTWNSSMPQGLQYCGYSPRAKSYPDDGFIDDTFLTDLNQFSLHDEQQNGSESPYFSTPVSDLDTRKLEVTSDYFSSPRINEINGGAADDQQDGNETSHDLNSSLSNPKDSPNDNIREKSSSPDGSSLCKISPEVSTSCTAGLRSPVDYLTLVWDYSLQEEFRSSTSNHTTLGELEKE